MNDVNLDSTDRDAFRDAGGAMRWVGIFWIVLAGLIAVATLLGLIGQISAKAPMGSLLAPLLRLVDQAVLVGAGTYTVQTAATLRHVVTESAVAQVSQEPSNRVGTLMKALGQLRGMFTLYAVFVGLAVLTEVIELVKG